MSQFPELSSNLSTANWRASVLTFLKSIASGGGGGSGGNVTITGSLPAGTNTIGGVTLPTSSSSSINNFTSSASAQVLAANASRKGIVIYNQSTNSVFILLGTGTVTGTNYSVSLGNSDVVTITGWTGAVQGLINSGTTNSVLVTELL